MNNNQNHSVYCQVNCLLWQAIYATGRHRDRDIAAACSEVLRILPLDCPCEPGRPGEYDACLERAKRGSRQDKYDTLIRALQLIKEDERHGDCAHHGEFCDRCTEPFTWQDAERIMLAGGECWHREPTEKLWRKARCRHGAWEWLSLDTKHWLSFDTDDDETRERLAQAEWRPCSAPAQYTWEQAKAGMRRGEIWEHREPGSNTWYRTTHETIFRCWIDGAWFDIQLHSPVAKALPVSDWRPYNPDPVDHG